MTTPDDRSQEERDFMEFFHRFRQAYPDRVGPDIHPTRRRTDPQPDPRTDREQVDLLGEGAAPKPWPTVAPAPPETQGVLPIDGTLQARWERWRATPEADALVAEVKRRALHEAAASASRVAVKRIIENVRGEKKRPINNSFVAFVAAELAEDPRLAPLIERRERRAS